MTTNEDFINFEEFLDKNPDWKRILDEVENKDNMASNQQTPTDSSQTSLKTKYKIPNGYTPIAQIIDRYLPDSQDKLQAITQLLVRKYLRHLSLRNIGTKIEPFYTIPNSRREALENVLMVDTEIYQQLKEVT